MLKQLFGNTLKCLSATSISQCCKNDVSCGGLTVKIYLRRKHPIDFKDYEEKKVQEKKAAAKNAWKDPKETGMKQ